MSRGGQPSLRSGGHDDDGLPALRAAGVTTDQIDQMLVRNPRAIFEAVG
jgi:predicted metal-dependent phosphotriesterase family hydrolase